MGKRHNRSARESIKHNCPGISLVQCIFMSLSAAQDILLDAGHLWFSLHHEHPCNFSQQLLTALPQTSHICQCLQRRKEPTACSSTILLEDEEQSILIHPQQTEWNNGEPTTCCCTECVHFLFQLSHFSCSTCESGLETPVTPSPHRG